MSDFPCPYCDKKFPMKHLLVNHIRQSSGAHGKKYNFPADYKEKMENLKVEQNEEISRPGDTEKHPNVEQTQEQPQTKIEKVTKVDPPEIPVTKTSKCPDCGEDKSNWITTREAHNHDINLSYKEIEEFDYVCLNCMELIKTS